MYQKAIKWVALGLFILISIIVIAWIVSPSDSPPYQSTHLNIGSEYIVVNNGFEVVWLAIDTEADDKWIEASTANDTIGLRSLMLSGQIFSVPAGTKVLVLDNSLWHGYKVRILEGDKFGKTGWLPSESLK